MSENTIKMRIPTTEEWDRLMGTTSSDNIITHWKNMFSWIRDQALEAKYSLCRAYRGYNSAHSYYYGLASNRRVHVGFRPAFDTLSSDFLPNGLGDGDIIIAGTLYMNGKPVKVPLNPVWDGDIESYIPGASLSFGPALDDPAYMVAAIKIGNTFIADRTLLNNISCKDIEQAVNSANVPAGPIDSDGITEILASLPSEKTAKKEGPNEECLAGDYILLMTHTTLTDKKAAGKNSDNAPLTYIAVKRDWFEQWGMTYTARDTDTMRTQAELDGALAFVYCADYDDSFQFPTKCEGNAMLAFADFLSGRLQENGHEDASKYIDALLEL